MHRPRRIRAYLATQAPPPAASAGHEAERAPVQQGTGRSTAEALALLEAYADPPVGHRFSNWPPGGETLDEWRRRSVG